MKFATIGHLLDENTLRQLPASWIQHDFIISPELDVYGTKGHLSGILITAKAMMTQPRSAVRQKILDAALFLQNEYAVDVVQLGALTTSVTNGGKWLTDQHQYNGYVNHGDSYTAAVTCKTVRKVLSMVHRDPADLTLAIVGAYGIIGEAVSKLIVPQFSHSILIGRDQSKFDKLEKSLTGNFETTVKLVTQNADVVVTATSHPTALLGSEHLKKNAIVVDVSQPVNLAIDVCRARPDVCRVDGGLVDFPVPIPIPGMPPGKNFACIAEVIMQALKEEKQHHVGSIELDHLHLTEAWGIEYGFLLNELTNFGTPIFQ